MPDNPTLIHLIGEQPMANLLPILALRPSHVIQICGSEQRFAASAEAISNAAREAGVHASFETVVLSATAPGVEAVRGAIRSRLAGRADGLVNLTGGTKLMSLGAYLAARDHGCPALYCDTRAKEFLQVGDYAFPGGIRPFTEVASSLTVRVVMAAHGRSPADWRFDVIGESHVTFGSAAWQLRTGYRDDFESCRFGGHIRAFFRSDRGRIPSSAEQLRALAQADLTSAIPGDLPAPVAEFLDAAVTAGFLLRIGGGGYCLTPGPDQKKKLRSHVEGFANLLDGAWLELAVLSFLQQSQRHRDPHWSVEPSAAGAKDSDYGETDLIAINADASSLEVISCKSSLEKPLEHLEGLRTRANNLGGSHALATLAVLHSQEEEKLRRWGRLLRVNILLGDEIPQHFGAPSPAIASNPLPAN